MIEDKNKASRNRTVLFLLFILPGIVGLYLLFMTFNGPPPLPKLKTYGVKLVIEGDTIYRKFQFFNFVNHLGERVNSSSFEDQIKIIHLFSTDCTDGCLEGVKHLVELQDYFNEGEDLHIISFTTNPTTDQPDVLNTFGERYETNNRQWTFLTGTDQQHKPFTYNDFFRDAFFNTNKSNLSQHQQLLLVDKTGHIRGYFNAFDQADVQKLQEHIEILKLEYGTHEKYR